MSLRKAAISFIPYFATFARVIHLIGLDLAEVTGENDASKFRKGVLGNLPRGAGLMVGPPSDLKPSDCGPFHLWAPGTKGELT